MTRGRRRTHLDDTRPGQSIRRALCSWLAVDTATDVSQVDCKKCLELFRAGRTVVGSRQAPTRAAHQADVAVELARAFAATLAPKAGPPPVLTPAVWAASCKGDGRCRSPECALCAWQSEAERWGSEDVAAWNREHRLERPAGAPRWPSLAAALCALVEHERHGRHGPSAMGGILRRIEMGEIGDGGWSRPDDPMLRRAGELVRVRQALDLAYPDGAHRLPAAARKAALLARTPGVVTQTWDLQEQAWRKGMPTYEELAAELDEPVGELRALVRAGRRTVERELAERGLIAARALHKSTNHAGANACDFGQISSCADAQNARKITLA